MGEINGSIGTIYYFVFTSVMTFIVMNFFFTILGDGFAQTQQEIQQLHNQYEIMTFLKGMLYVNVPSVESCANFIYLEYSGDRARERTI